MSLGDLRKKLKPFSNNIYVINGHNEAQIKKSLKKYSEDLKIIVANTIKGFGSKIIEKDNIWSKLKFSFISLILQNELMNVSYKI